MWKDTLLPADLEGETGSALCARIEKLAQIGCGILRFAVPDIDAVEPLGRLAGMITVPFVADIHFDYKIALRCLDYPIAALRINPGNIGGAEKVRQVLEKAAAKGVPIRIGVNAGSLPQDIRRDLDSEKITLADAIVSAAEREMAIFDQYRFTNYAVSMKASSVADTILANRRFKERFDGNGDGPPLHVGVTEAGPLIAGTVRNTAALCTLLKDDIGDTIRVSLSDTPESEVIAGREILRLTTDCTDYTDKKQGVRQSSSSSSAKSVVSSSSGVKIVSCPRCGRHSFDSIGFTARWQERLYALKTRRPVTVAIMGCAVNGPGEARGADLGITGAGDKVLIFRKGEIVRTINAAEADAVFAAELGRLAEDKNNG
jgi:(E)-4-hydroxy-3-methylbut-2-enyl-diphosphate synthase